MDRMFINARIPFWLSVYSAEGWSFKQVCSHMFEGVKRVDGCRYPPEYEGPASGLGGRSAANSHRYSDDYCTTDYGQNATFPQVQDNLFVQVN